MCGVQWWLLTCAVLVIIIVWIGGVTRLTNAGLSITEWKPVTGVLLPITDEGWAIEQAKYAQTPEYKKNNVTLAQDEFKKIYIIEYIHRLFARFIGFVFIIPFIYFILRRQLQGKGLILTLVVMCIGALQGFIGWYMVQSGLTDQAHVSQYRLSLHLFLATVILFILLWVALPNQKHVTAVISGVRSLILSMIILVILQIAMGGLVAGLDAGLVYNTFPLMDGRLIPKGLLSISPVWKNIFENIATVQFLHRVIGIGILINAILLSCLDRNRLTFSILILVMIQITLGILTLILHVEIIIASLHQINAFFILVLSVLCHKRLLCDNTYID